MKISLDRGALADVVVLAVSAFALYFSCALPGVGWSEEALLQTDVALYFGERGVQAEGRLHPVLTAAGAVFSRVISVGDPAWRVTMLCLLASVLSLALVYLGLRQLVAHRSAALMGAIALAFSHSFFLHAVRPSVYAPSATLFAVEIALVVRFRFFRERIALAAAWFAAISGASLLPDATLGFVIPVVFITAMRFARISFIFAGLLAAHAAFVWAESNLGALTYPLLLLFIAFQFPFVGWLLAFWGGMFLGRRFPGLFGIMTLSALSAAPLVYGETLNQFFGAMLISSIPVSYLVGLGADHILERLERMRGEIPIAPVVIVGSLVLMPLMTMASILYSFRNAEFDRGLADRGVWRIESSRWRDDIWYSFWPPKFDQGAGGFLDEVERVVPPGATIIVEPGLAPVIEYARFVEGRYAAIEILMLEASEQMPRARDVARMGRRVFLAGIASPYYDVRTMGENGEVRAAGGLYEWIPLRPEGTAPGRTGSR